MLTASITDGIATVRGLPQAARSSWVWVYAYSSPSTLGWYPVDTTGTVVIPVTALADGAHLISFFRGDELIASSSFVLGGQQVLPATGAPVAVEVAPNAALSALGLGMLLLALVGIRRSAMRRRASPRP